MKPPMPSDLAGLAARESAPKKAPKVHTVRHKDGGTITVEGYTRGKAVRLMCTECLGFETNPSECTSVLCPLYPFRRVTYATRRRREEENR